METKHDALSSVDIGVSQAARDEVAGGLSRVLADTFSLYLKTHGYHWNVTGPAFATLHGMFEDQYTSMWSAADEIAERIRALGHKAPASYAEFTELAVVPEDKTGDAPDANRMVANLLEGHETIARTIRPMLKVAAEAGDDVSADILTQRLHDHEKTAWMLRSMAG